MVSDILNELHKGNTLCPARRGSNTQQLVSKLLKYHGVNHPVQPQ